MVALTYGHGASHYRTCGGDIGRPRCRHRRLRKRSAHRKYDKHRSARLVMIAIPKIKHRRETAPPLAIAHISGHAPLGFENITYLGGERAKCRRNVHCVCTWVADPIPSRVQHDSYFLGLKPRARRQHRG